MRNLVKILLIAVIYCLCFTQTTKAQDGYFYDMGISLGPVAFQSDYGERGDFDTNAGNVGFGGSIFAYINFPYDFDNYFNDHFKIRAELSYHSTNLDHFGIYTENDTESFKLQAMTGKSSVFEIGPSLEYHYNSIRDYESGQMKFSPFVGLGLRLVLPSASASTTLSGGTLGQDRSVTWPTFIGRIDQSPGITGAIVGDIGFRYKINRESDLVFSSKWNYYFSDVVDGLDPNNVNNRSNDWIWTVSVGYIYYFDFF